MLTFLAIVHILIGLCLIAFVLLQDPKGGAMGVFSGGSSSTSFFGASGASNFLTTTTKWMAVMFAGTCLGLTWVSSHQTKSVLDNYVPPVSAPAMSEPAEAIKQESVNPSQQGATPTQTPPAAPTSTENKQ